MLFPGLLLLEKQEFWGSTAKNSVQDVVVLYIIAATGQETSCFGAKNTCKDQMGHRFRQ